MGNEMRTRNKVFVSYASEDREPAYRIGLRLGQCGFNVFFDRDKLAPGAQYDETIRRERLLIWTFLFSWLSKHSLQQGRYTLTELSFARQKWPNSAGDVLPVNIGRPGKVASEFSDSMSYVTAVSAFWPKGEVAAEVVGEGLRMAEKEPGSVCTLIRPVYRRIFQGRRRQERGIHRRRARRGDHPPPHAGGRKDLRRGPQGEAEFEIEIARPDVSHRQRALLSECFALVRMVGKGQQEFGKRYQVE